MATRKENPIRRTTKGKGANYRPTKSGAGMTSKGVKAYRSANPGSKLKTAVTGKAKPGSAAAKRRKSTALDLLGSLRILVLKHVMILIAEYAKLVNDGSVHNG